MLRIFTLEDSFIFARTNAWGAKAVFDKSYAAVCLGTPVRGVLTPTDSTCDSAQLSCWSPSSFFEWKTASPRSFFPEGVVLGHDAIYHLPLLGKRNLDTSGSAYSKISIQPDNLKLLAAKSSSLPATIPPRDTKPPAKPRVKPDDWESLKEEARFERKLKRLGLLKGEKNEEHEASPPFRMSALPRV